jgi:hypothetical protein
MGSDFHKLMRVPALLKKKALLNVCARMADAAEPVQWDTPSL